MATPTSKQKFDKDRSGFTVQPPPPFPRLPEAFVKRYEPAIQDALNKYSDDCAEWLRKFIQGQL